MNYGTQINAPLDAIPMKLNPIETVAGNLLEMTAHNRSNVAMLARILMALDEDIGNPPEPPEGNLMEMIRINHEMSARLDGMLHTLTERLGIPL